MTVHAETSVLTQRAKLDTRSLRAQFPILAERFHGKPLVYLDNAATTQKPARVIEAVRRYYSSQNANIHRGVYALSQVATDLYEGARERVRAFVNAAEAREILFTRGTTESINLVAACWGRANLHAGDEIVISAMEHHSNIVPWQMIAQHTGAVIRVAPMDDRGELEWEAFTKLLGPRTKFVSMVHVSNSLGTMNPVADVIRAAHGVGAKVLVDGAQWVAHGRTDVRALDADFYAFSGHKLYGPTGIGVLYGKAAILESMPPWMGGGDMIERVTFERTTYAGLPNRFEAGTPNIAGAAGLAAAIDFVDSIGFEAIAAQEADLLACASERIGGIAGVKLVGTARRKASVLSFVVEGMSSLDVGVKLDLEGIAVRTGHHCCQPVMDRFGIPGTVRASLAMYNTRDEVEALAAALERITAASRARHDSGADGKSHEASVEYPAAFGPSPWAVADELAEEFAFLGDRTARSEYVLDLGKQLPDLFAMLKRVTEPVPGCMSEVYVVGRRSPKDPAVLEFVADANAEIVRGLIAVLQRLYSGQRARDVLAFDIESFFRRIQLDQFLSSQRRNGLQGMVTRIRALAASVDGGEHGGRP